jgi:hypothetical protein
MAPCRLLFPAAACSPGLLAPCSLPLLFPATARMLTSSTPARLAAAHTDFARLPARRCSPAQPAAIRRPSPGRCPAAIRRPSSGRQPLLDRFRAPPETERAGCRREGHGLEDRVGEPVVFFSVREISCQEPAHSTDLVKRSHSAY